VNPSGAVYEVSSQAPSGVLVVFARRARTVHVNGTLPPCPRVLASSLPEHSFPTAARPLHSQGGERRWGKNALPPSRHAPSHRRAVADAFASAGVSSGPDAPRRDNRLSVGDRPRPPAPVTVYAQGVRHATVGAHPSNARCLRRSPGGKTAARTDPASAGNGGGLGFDLLKGSLLPSNPRLTPYTVAAAAAFAAFACRRAVESTRSRQSFSTAPAGSSPWST